MQYEIITHGLALYMIMSITARTRLAPARTSSIIEMMTSRQSALVCSATMYTQPTTSSTSITRKAARKDWRLPLLPALTAAMRRQLRGRRSVSRTSSAATVDATQLRMLYLQTKMKYWKTMAKLEKRWSQQTSECRQTDSSDWLLPPLPASLPSGQYRLITLNSIIRTINALHHTHPYICWLPAQCECQALSLCSMILKQRASVFVLTCCWWDNGIIINTMATLGTHKQQKENSYQPPLLSKKDKGEDFLLKPKTVLAELTQPELILQEAPFEDEEGRMLRRKRAMQQRPVQEFTLRLFAC